jgi:hypothetical protein
MLDDREFSPQELNPIIMRLFVPNYEQARPYFERARREGIVGEELAPGYFSQSDLLKIIKEIPRLAEN